VDRGYGHLARADRIVALSLLEEDLAYGIFTWHTRFGCDWDCRHRVLYRWPRLNRVFLAMNYCRALAAIIVGF
jgi:hypothetical protein